MKKRLVTRLLMQQPAPSVASHSAMMMGPHHTGTHAYGPESFFSRTAFMTGEVHKAAFSCRSGLGADIQPAPSGESTELATTPNMPAWPEYGLTDNLLPTLQRWQENGQRVALATLVSLHGPSPRPLGSEMVINSAGDVAGYVSGGCVEGAVATEALAVLRERKPRLLDYGAGSPVLDIQLACGGRIGIFVREITDLSTYLHLPQKAQQKRCPLQVETHLVTGEMRVSLLEIPLLPSPPENCFLRLTPPPLRLVLAGGDPITLALVNLAPHFGLTPLLLRPRGPEAPPATLPRAAYDRRPLAQALTELGLDRWTAVYSLAHDSEIDHAIARAALHSEAFCIGILGSKARIPERLARLRAEGFHEESLRRLRLPAGLPLSSRTPSGIALSILAEVLQHAPAFEACSGKVSC